MSKPRVSIAVFAYNEAELIKACLDSIQLCADEAELSVYVLVNGCTDETEAIVRAYRPRGFLIVPIVIARGDKANAWNVYVHEAAPADVDIHVFTDGDMRMLPGTITGFFKCFEEQPEAQACAALPVSGRSRVAFREKLTKNREMAGNLYALRNACVRAFRRAGLRLPFGVFGEDGLVTSLVKYDLDTLGVRRDDRIAVCEAGGFAFSPLSPWRMADIQTYRKRRRSYAVRRRQNIMLYRLLYERGVSEMPRHIVDLYLHNYVSIPQIWLGLETFFDWEARRKIEKERRGASSSSTKSDAHPHG